MTRFGFSPDDQLFSYDALTKYLETKGSRPMGCLLTGRVGSFLAMGSMMIHLPNPGEDGKKKDSIIESTKALYCFLRQKFHRFV